MVLNRYVYEQDTKTTGIPAIVYIYFKWATTKRTKAQGYGLHSFEECKKKKFII